MRSIKVHNKLQQINGCNWSLQHWTFHDPPVECHQRENEQMEEFVFLNTVCAKGWGGGERELLKMFVLGYFWLPIKNKLSGGFHSLWFVAGCWLWQAANVPLPHRITTVFRLIDNGCDLWTKQYRSDQRDVDWNAHQIFEPSHIPTGQNEHSDIFSRRLVALLCRIQYIKLNTILQAFLKTNTAIILS